MPSNHFQIELLKTFADVLEAMEISPADFLNEVSRRRFDDTKPVASNRNFAVACDSISELALPSWTSRAYVRFFHTDGSDIETMFGASASSGGGRQYVEAVQTDSFKTLRLHDLVVELAEQLGLRIT